MRESTFSLWRLNLQLQDCLGSNGPEALTLQDSHCINLTQRLPCFVWSLKLFFFLHWANIKILAVVQSLSPVQLFVTPWTAGRQPSLSFTISRSLLKFISIESAMPSSHLILCCPLLFLPSVFLSIRVFSNELALCIRWPQYWSFSFSISPSNEYSELRVDFLQD